RRSLRAMTPWDRAAEKYPLTPSDVGHALDHFTPERVFLATVFGTPVGLVGCDRQPRGATDRADVSFGEPIHLLRECIEAGRAVSFDDANRSGRPDRIPGF